MYLFKFGALYGYAIVQLYVLKKSTKVQGPYGGFRLIFTHISSIVNGGWSNWGLWGGCSLTCGGGVQTRTRICTNPSPARGGVDCQGHSSQSQSCNTKGCPGTLHLSHN